MLSPPLSCFSPSILFLFVGCQSLLVQALCSCISLPLVFLGPYSVYNVHEEKDGASGEK